MVNSTGSQPKAELIGNEAAEESQDKTVNRDGFDDGEEHDFARHKRGDDKCGAFFGAAFGILLEREKFGFPGIVQNRLRR